MMSFNTNSPDNNFIDTIELSKETFVEQKKLFAQYLNSRQNGVVEISRESAMGKYLRVMRYYDVFHDKVKESALPIHVQGLIALAIVESKGDPLSRNLQNGGGSDGGAGLLHTQPDTAVRLGLSTYADKKGNFAKPFTVQVRKDGKMIQYTVTKFADCAYETLIKKGFSRADAYKIHGAGLVQLKEELNLNHPKLSAMDDRFNHTKNIESALKYFQKARTSIQAWAKRYNKTLSTSDLELYTLNSYNKGYGWSLGGGKPNPSPRFLEGGTHMKNISATIKQYNKYNSIVESGLRDGLTSEQIYANLTKGAMTQLAITKPKKATQKQSTKEIKQIEQRINTISDSEIMDKKLLMVKNVCGTFDEGYSLRVLGNGIDHHAAMIAISPKGNYKTRYQMSLSVKNNYWTITSPTGISFKMIEGSSYDISQIIKIVFDGLITSLKHKPDSDNKKPYFYDNGEVKFDKNWSFRDEIIIPKDKLKPLLDKSPDKKKELGTKVADFIADLAKNHIQTQ